MTVGGALAISKREKPDVISKVGVGGVYAMCVGEMPKMYQENQNETLSLL